MDNISAKADNVPAPTGAETAAEYNDRRVELQAAVTDSGQVLAAGTTNQLTRSIGNQGKRTTLSSGTAEPGQTVIVDNSGGSVTINLPATPATNTLVHFEPTPDEPYSANNFTMGRNGQTIMGLAEDMVVGGATSTDNKKITMRFDGTTWGVSLISTVGTTL